jgi:hypothetical protein
VASLKNRVIFHRDDPFLARQMVNFYHYTAKEGMSRSIITGGVMPSSMRFLRMV